MRRFLNVGRFIQMNAIQKNSKKKEKKVRRLEGGVSYTREKSGRGKYFFN